MLTTIKRLLERSWLPIAILSTVLIAVLSLMPTTNFPKIELAFQDKIYHMVAYFFLALSWFFSSEKLVPSRKTLSKTAILVVIYGIVIEVLQATITNYRTFDTYDIVANSTGVLIAFFSFKKIKAILS